MNEMYFNPTIVKPVFNLVPQSGTTKYDKDFLLRIKCNVSILRLRQECTVYIKPAPMISEDAQNL